MNYKIFIGFRIPSEWQWRKMECETLQSVIYQERAYIGKYFTSPTPSMHEIRAEGTLIVNALSHHYPELRLDISSLCVFSQLFIG